MSNNVKISYHTNQKKMADKYRSCPHCGVSGNNIRTLKREGDGLLRKCLSCEKTHIKDISNGFQ